MYEAFYDLKAKPFQKTPDPRFLYRSEVHQEALDRLLYAVEERELIVMVGGWARARPCSRGHCWRSWTKVGTSSLSEEDSARYIRHGLAVAGCTGLLFNAGALKALYKYSQGLPRSLNNLANMALLSGFTRGRREIDEAIVHDIAYEVEGRWKT